MLHAFLLRNGHFSPRRYRHYSISENVLQRNRDFIFSSARNRRGESFRPCVFPHAFRAFFSSRRYAFPARSFLFPAPPLAFTPLFSFPVPSVFSRPAPLFVFFRELPLLFPAFLSTRSHSSRVYFHSFQNSFSEPFPALCFFQALSSLTPLSISFFLPFSSSFFLPFSSRLPAIFLFVATLPYSNRLYSLRRGSSIKGIKTEFCTYRYSSLMRILSSSRSK